MEVIEKLGFALQNMTTWPRFSENVPSLMRRRDVLRFILSWKIMESAFIRKFHVREAHLIYVTEKRFVYFEVWFLFSISMPVLHSLITLNADESVAKFRLSFFFSFYWDGVRLSPLGMSATDYSIIQTPDHRWVCSL
jgi:hypothetical protein